MLDPLLLEETEGVQVRVPTPLRVGVPLTLILRVPRPETEALELRVGLRVPVPLRVPDCDAV